jgi:hypothetical protein
MEVSKNQMNQPQPPEEITVEELLGLYDETFITKAYEVILYRAPDPGGLANYLAQVRAGVDKAQIIVELAQSQEGKDRPLRLLGLRDLIAEYPRRASTFFSRMVRRLATPSLEPTARQLRAIDNHMYLLEQSLARQGKQIAELLSSVQHLAESLDGLSSTVRTTSNDVAIQLPPLATMSPSVARIYAKLKAAIAMKRPE